MFIFPIRLRPRRATSWKILTLFSSIHSSTRHIHASCSKFRKRNMYDARSERNTAHFKVNKMRSTVLTLHVVYSLTGYVTDWIFWGVELIHKRNSNIKCWTEKKIQTGFNNISNWPRNTAQMQQRSAMHAPIHLPQSNETYG